MISSRIADCLRPLEQFEEIRRSAIRLGDRLSDLSYANPYGDVTGAARRVIREALDAERELDLQYTPFGGHTLSRRAVADALRESHGLHFRYSDVVLTPGAMAALNLAMRLIARPGGEVIIPVPCWLDYPVYALNAGLQPVFVPLEEHTLRLDPDAIATAMTEDTCGVLISHPSNPGGRNYPRESAQRLAAILEASEERFGRPVSLILDETHRDFIAVDAFHSFSAAWPRSLITYSFGKYHFIQGQRLGYVAISPEHPEREDGATHLTRDTRVTGFCTPTALMQRALPGLLELHHDLDGLDRWRRRITEELAGSGYRVTPADGTFFLYVATPDGLSDWDFVRQLAEEALLVLPAPIFHHTGHVRLSLTGDEGMLERGLDVLKEFAAR